ncbi:DUF6950 family protein [Paracoccus sulfuroxidans]|uniref:DUF6950 family protein n=1 Tax=Paracoccus sulfuroxidans TaxID=384678 RepID=UPI00119FF65B|nr:hypothetical protein [Paracoccus sulfuroxidans]
MKRREDWRSRLYSYLDSVRDIPFQYGVQDCALFTASCVEAQTGEDPASDFRGRYTTELGGLRKIRAAGFDDQRDFVAKTFHEITDVVYTQVGDIVILNEGPLGLCVGDRVAAVGEEGIYFVSLDDIQRAFSIEGGRE